MKLIRCFTLWMLLALVLWTGALPGGAESASPLRGYSKEDGYVYLTLGEYPQTADGEIQPILWRVLTADEEKAFLLSEYILFARVMHSSLKEYRDVIKGDFSRTDLCRYLNTEFAEQAFTEEEMEMFLPFENFGKIFLISRDDMNNKEYGLGKTLVDSRNVSKIKANPGLRAWGTEWAIKDNGYPVSEYPNPEEYITGLAGAKVPVKGCRLYVFSSKFASHSPYWARTASTSDARHAVCIKDGGQIGHIEVGRDNEGVRPALYLANGSYEIAGGSGTMEDPYSLRPRE